MNFPHTQTNAKRIRTHTHFPSIHLLDSIWTAWWGASWQAQAVLGGLWFGSEKPHQPPFSFPAVFSNTLLYLYSLCPPLQNSGVCAWYSHLKIRKSHSTFNVRSSTCYGVLLCIGTCKGVLNSKQKKARITEQAWSFTQHKILIYRKKDSKNNGFYFTINLQNIINFV